MGKINRKFLPIIGVLVAAIFVVTIYVQLERNSTPSPIEESEQRETVTISIAQDMPPAARTMIETISLTREWETIETNANADITIRYSLGISDSPCSENASLYQILIVSVPYAQMLNSPSGPITSVSDFVDIPADMASLGEFTIAIDRNAGDAEMSLTTIQEVDPTVYALSAGGISPFAKESWTTHSYPLISQICIDGDEKYVAAIMADIAEDTFLDDYNYVTALPTSELFTTIFKTGTSVSGGPGWELCELRRGLNYPILNVAPKLNSADISILSNEASFVDGCSQEAGTMSFCGKPAYLQNLLDMGIDIISLTGNHMCDYGRTAFENMLTTYSDNSIQYFGGGITSTEAWSPLLIETNAGTIAFIGYNNMGPGGVLASETVAGTANYDSDKLKAAIESADSDIIWVDTHLWPEYGTTPTNEQVELTREAIDYGADIVTGVSSHEIQGMTFYNGKPVYYGLGNFLFDQMWSDETRLGMALEVILFDGKISQILPHPTRMYDYCQPRFLEGVDRNTILDYFISISELGG